MLQDEDYFWIFLSFLGGCFWILYRYDTVREPFDKESEYSKTLSILGNATQVKLKTIRPIIPYPAVALRDQVQVWVVNVPLTPFRSPLLTLPSIPTPSFLLYNPSELTPVRNQGTCGACWAFAVCDMLSDRTMIMTQGRFRRNLSVQQLLSCFDRTGCDGGSPEEACLWLQQSQTLLYPDTEFPYQQQKGTDVTVACPRKPPEKTVAVSVKAGSTSSIVEYIEEKGYNPLTLAQNIVNMKRALVLGGPFYCAMAVYDDLFTYSGLRPYQPDKAASLVGGHAINIIGYCDKGVDTREHYKDVGYWICRNSWGHGWPTQTDLSGYFTVVMGSNVCGIESRCGFATPQLFGNVYGISKPLDKLRFVLFEQYLQK